MTIPRVKFPWPPFFRIFIFFDEVFNSVRGTTYLMRDDGATVVNVRSSRVIWSPRNPTDLSVHPCSDERLPWGVSPLASAPPRDGVLVDAGSHLIAEAQATGGAVPGA